VAVLNPLVLLVLLGGAHNDALMLGLLVTACALARRNHFVVALALCALAAEVKIPALIGAGFIGWWWSGVHSTWRRRIPRAALALVAVVGLMGASSEACGLGWRWLGALSNPGVVVSWLDPATAVGLALSRAAGLLGLSGHAAGFVDVSRAVSVGLAAVLSFVLLVRARQIGSPQGLGWSLLAFVVLGPVIWPWYESWGFVFLAVVAEAWTLRIVLVFSALACFADVPAARFFGTDPSLAVICWTLLLGGVIAFASLRLVPSLPRPIVPARRPGVRARTVR
jgi:alpha-1,6-mannosyltransferase